MAAFDPLLPRFQAHADALVGTKAEHIPSGGVELPRISLRGFGAVSATFQRFPAPGGPTSILTLHCETLGKALLVQAKYLSDIGLLPGIEPFVLKTPHGARAAHRMASGALCAACAVEKVVYVFSAKRAQDLIALLAAHLPTPAPPHAFLARAQVPMYLDRWDRYGLLAYEHFNTLELNVAFHKYCKHKFFF